jgi:hypothetical protein
MSWLIEVEPGRSLESVAGAAWNFFTYCFTPDLLETLQKTAIKRCQLSQLRVFVVCPEHANMFNILRKPQNISK